ncbi:peroxisomal nicotinamide adenine dinucleotide carrier-like isoform X3 [Coffea eugenioides]|uniref:Peroxisomal nicotinamide adenine dinucleotide carrier-like isoform X2 n=1 Tax=Coffea arabica TaxID=13443 RepID=A0A6P6UKS7_COFAR|nr:peroxisomal nicotinamide adenine dinucleotide carrier-like isoform X2 [Coffea arabica]XP_027149228.1 peroxisomal nicotinamide adenine dinucleotide carrier-like isoform X3 [Coffea eugenioides]
MHFVLPPDKGNVHHSQQRVIELTKLVGSGREIADTMSNAVVNGLAGAGGGIIAQIITYPLQTVNTRQQTERVAKKDANLLVPHQPPPVAGGTLLHMFEVIRSEGLGGLYSGLMPSLLGTAASQGVYYYFYQVFKNKAEAIAAKNMRKGQGDGSVGMFSWLVVAALAGSLNVLLTNPIWVLVTRMQTHTQAERKIMEAKREELLREDYENTFMGALQEKLVELESIKPQPYGAFDAACEVYGESGLRGFWKGIIPTLIMVCNPSIQFMIYETSLKHLRATRGTNKKAVKSVTALESRLQAKQEIGGNISQRYTGTVDAILKMIRHEGVCSFYKGMSTKIVQSVIAASVLFMVKEELVKAYTVLISRRHKIMANMVQ